MLSVKRVCSLSFFGTNGIQIFMSINGISGNYHICKVMYRMASIVTLYGRCERSDGEGEMECERGLI